MNKHVIETQTQTLKTVARFESPVLSTHMLRCLMMRT
jgi:hypothetical protein